MAARKVKQSPPAGTEKHKGGRPRIVIDKKVLKSIALLQCTDEELAIALECSVDTLARARKRDPEIDQIIAAGRAQGRLSLRRAQFRSALGDPEHEIAPNVTAQIWLGKQWLDQRDNIDLRQDEPMPAAIKVTIVDATKKNHDDGAND